MSRNKLFGVALAGLALLVAVKLAFAAPVPVANTKHNLGASGPLAYKSAETQICVFCHTPHRPNISVPFVPLWNRTTTTASYSLYTSGYLTALTYDAPVLAAGQSSRICLSCHDGTIALGTVKNINGGTSITMGGGVTTMPVGTANFGSNLSDDHPVGYAYLTAKDTELITRAWPWPKGVQLDPNTALGRVECRTCHEPHDNQYTKFLRTSNAGGAICKTCHQKTGFTGSGHDLSAQAYTPIYGIATTVGANSCVNCHKPHGGGQQLLRYAEEATCYEQGCHGSNNPNGNTTQAYLNIGAEMTKTHKHPTNTYSGMHNDIPSPTYESVAQLGDGNRHAECYDCHEPHAAKPTPTNKATRGNIRLSQALLGTWGVKPNAWPAAPTTMTTNKVLFAAIPGGAANYTKVYGATLLDEYQVCLKCHSNYVTLPVTVPVTRNLAEEINPNNSSYHGIVRFTDAAETVRAVTNFYVNSNTTAQPWGGAALTIAAAEACRTTPGGAACNTFADGRGRVWCSDCHGSEATVMPPVATTVPKGPHGSSLNNAGPGTSNSDKMLIATLQTVSGTGIQATPLCVKCHLPASYQTGKAFSRMGMHGSGGEEGPEGCFACHMWENPNIVTGGAWGAVGSGDIFPHGWNKKWTRFPDGTTAGATTVMVDAFVGGWLSQVNYTTKLCWNSASNAGGSPTGTPCGTIHNGNKGY